MRGDRHQGRLGPRLEPDDGAAGDETRELESSRAELLPDRREGEDHVKVDPHPLNEPLDGVVPGGRQAARFSLHDWQTLVNDLLELVLVEKVDDGTPGEDGVDVLEESFLLYVLIREQESRSLALCPAALEEVLEVLHEVAGVVGPGHGHLEGSVAGDEGGELGERLLPRTSDSNQQRIAT